MAIISKTIQTEFGKFERITLTEEEMEKKLNELLEHNYREINRIKDFLMKKEKEVDEEIFRILCDKQLWSSFSTLMNALDEKAFDIRNKSRQKINYKEKIDEVKKMIKEELMKNEEVKK